MLPAFLARLHSTIGGFRETELKLLAVSPMSVPSIARVVTMVTPVANAPRALRKARSSMVESAAVMRSAGDGFATVRCRVPRQMRAVPGLREGDHGHLAGACGTHALTPFSLTPWRVA